MRFFNIVAAIVLGVGSPLWVEAAQAPCGGPEAALAAGDYDRALNLSRLCLGDPAADSDTLVVGFNSATPLANTADQRLQAVVLALTDLHDFARRRALLNTDAMVWREVAEQLKSELEIAGNSQLATQLRLQAIRERFWEVPSHPDPVVLNGTIRPLQPTGCHSPPAPCAVYASRTDLLRLLRLMDRLIGYVNHPQLTQHFTEAKLMNDRWDAYFNKALPQYWWEVAINGARMGEDLCPKEPKTGIQLGFCSVPDSQLIILHPSAALQWVRGADEKDDLAAAFVVEIFGHNSWEWKDSALHGQFGWSLIAAYSNPDGEQKNWSYGVMLHKGSSLNLGVTTAGGGQVSVLVSIKLADKIFARKTEYLDYLKNLRKPSWEDLL